MAQAGFTPIQLYRTTTASAVPTAGNLAAGELAINLTDKKLYAKDASNNVFLLADASSGGTTATNLAGGAAGSLPYQTGANATTFRAIGTAGQVLQVNSGATAPEWVNSSGTGDVARTTSPTFTTPILGTPTSVTLTNATGLPLTTGVTGTLPAANGGTGQASYTTGDLLYATGSTALSKLGIGTNGQILTSTGTAPQWSTLSGVAVTTFSAGTTGFTPNSATSGAVTLAGTLATTNGGTGLTSFTSGGVVYASSTSALATGSALTFDGTNLGVGTTSSGANIRLYASVDGSNGLLRFFDQGGTRRLDVYASGSSAAYMSTGGNVPLVFAINDLEQMRLTSTGLGIGLGGGSPVGKLQVTGSSASFIFNTSGTEFYNNNAGQVKIYTSNAAGFLSLGSGGRDQDLLIAATTGNVGIGTNSPQKKLHVRDDTIAVGHATMILQGYVGGYGAGVSFQSFLNATTTLAEMARITADGESSWGTTASTQDAGLRFYTALDGTVAEKMRLDSSGNVGIGTISPAVRLALKDTSPQIDFITSAASDISASIYGAVDTGTGGKLVFRTKRNGNTPVDVATLDSSGNLGLGVTPSAWGAQQAIEFAYGGLSIGSTLGVQLVSNTYYSGTNWIYRASSTAYRYEQDSSGHKWYNAPSGTAGNPMTGANAFVQAMTLDASGNLSVGTTSQYGRLNVFDGTTAGATTPGVLTLGASSTTVASGEVLGRVQFYSSDASVSSAGVVGKIDCVATSTFVGDCETALTFHTNDGAAGTIAERARISSDGTFRVKGAGTAGSTDAVQFSGSAPASAMTLDASGNLGVGVTSAGCRFNATQAASAALGAQIALHNNASTAVGNAVEIALLTDSGASPSGIRNGRIRVVNENAGDGAANMQFWTWSGTTDAERARITSGGDFGIGNTNPQYRLTVDKDTTSALAFFTNSNASAPNGAYIDFSAASPNNATQYFMYCEDSTAQRATIFSNGGLANYQGNDTNLSDRREKTNFAPAKSYLDTICAIPVQTFNYIDQNLEEDPGLTLGVVAQDVQAVAPELVMESNWGTEDNPKMRLSIYQTDMQYALMKCIQELKAQNDDLRARVAALEAQP